MKNPKDQETPNIITCIDSGEWSNSLGFSQPRMYTPLRELEANGRLRIARIKYIRSPIIDRRFPEESDPSAPEADVYKLRHNTRWAVEKERVWLTAENFGVKEKCEEFNFADKAAVLSPTVCVNMRPGGEDQSINRQALLTDLIERDAVERILLSPPYFKNSTELEHIETIDKRKKLVLWTPYRYTAAVVYAKQVLQNTALGGGNLIVISGPYPIKRFLVEFALPFLDAYLDLTGEVLKQDEALKLSIQLSARNGLPVFSISAKHATGATSTILLSTLGGAFGNIDHSKMTLLFSDMTHIDLSNSLIIYNHRTPNQHFSNGMSHDPPRSTLNGARYLVNACLSETNTDDLPTVSRFKQTQEVIDKLLCELQCHENLRRLENESVSTG